MKIGCAWCHTVIRWPADSQHDAIKMNVIDVWTPYIAYQSVRNRRDRRRSKSRLTDVKMCVRTLSYGASPAHYGIAQWQCLLPATQQRCGREQEEAISACRQIFFSSENLSFLHLFVNLSIWVHFEVQFLYADIHIVYNKSYIIFLAYISNIII